MALAFGYERYLPSLCGQGWLPPLREVSFWERLKAEGSSLSIPERYSNTLKEVGETQGDHTRKDLTISVGEEGYSCLMVMRADPDTVRWKGSGPAECARGGSVSRGRGGRLGTERQLRKLHCRRICE